MARLHESGDRGGGHEDYGKGLERAGIVDEIVREPEGGAHVDHEAAARFLEEVLDRQLVALTNQPFGI